jgi:hypothetical protein
MPFYSCDVERCSATSCAETDVCAEFYQATNHSQVPVLGCDQQGSGTIVYRLVDVSSELFDQALDDSDMPLLGYTNKGVKPSLAALLTTAPSSFTRSLTKST